MRLPAALSAAAGATLGVAFVTSALALGVCFGLDFSAVLNGPNMFDNVREIADSDIPSDVKAECLQSIAEHDRAMPGDWIAIWGGKF